MTMHIETIVTGNQLGRLLAQDPEELGYALAAMSETMNSGLPAYAEDLVRHHDDIAPELISFLRDFADAMEVAHAKP